MEIGTEISQKIRAAIKTKLQDLGSYVDDELPDYIMVMLANKRNQDQMTEDLNLFLGNNTDKFTLWLFNLLAKLQDATSFKEEEQVKETQTATNETAQVIAEVEPKIDVVHHHEQESPVLARKSSPSRTGLRDGRRKSTERVAIMDESKTNLVRQSDPSEKPKVTSSVLKSGHSSLIVSKDRLMKKRRLSNSDDEDTRINIVPSVVRVRERVRPSVPASKQASGMLLKKAVAEAQLSVSRLQAVSSLSYDPTSPPSPIHGYDQIEKQQKKKLFLQQHKELQKQLSEQSQLSDLDLLSKEIDLLSKENLDTIHTEETTEERKEELPKSTTEIQEPVIQLRVSEAEELELQLEAGDEIGQGDTRVVAFADSQAGGDESEDEQQKRKKRRSVKSREKPASPKFVVTLDGVDSDLEEKYDKEQKRKRRRKHRKEKDEFDEFIDVDTSDISRQGPPLPLPPQAILPGMVPPLVLPPPPIPQVQGPSLIPEPVAVPPTVDPLAFKLNTASDDEGIDEEVDDTVKEKCKFWPDCRNGDACAFYHPTVPCRSFPSCKFGESCLFIHPQCKYDGRCSNPSCPYTHKSKSQASSSPSMMTPVATAFPKVSPTTTIPKLCRYHPACTNSSCPFYHPRGTSSSKPCRYGSSCSRTDCMFSHPPAKPASGSALKWVSPSLIHISERNFAVPEEKVLSLPVK